MRTPTPIHPEDHFAADYGTSRRAFLQAAEAAGAALTSHPVAARGARGEELATDVAYLGPQTPERLLVVSSGIHGVEGFAGSALQHQLLAGDLLGASLLPGTGALLVHALNPYGFHALRRVNESNVDLNRNFVQHPEGHEQNPGYETLFHSINPERLDEESDAAAQRAFLGFAREHGFDQLQEALSCGQYCHAGGVQFGGVRPEDSNRTLREIARHALRGAREVAWLDIHTGLGPYGVPEMILELPLNHPAFLRARTWFGEAARSTVAGESVSPKLPGVMDFGLLEELPEGTTLTPAAMEFGTYDANRVFWAMRADNWLQQHGEPESERGRSIRAELLEVFRPADPAWQRQVLARGEALVRCTLEGLQGI